MLTILWLFLSFVYIVAAALATACLQIAYDGVKNIVLKGFIILAGIVVFLIPLICSSVLGDGGFYKKIICGSAMAAVFTLTVRGRLLLGLIGGITAFLLALGYDVYLFVAA